MTHANRPVVASAPDAPTPVARRRLWLGLYLAPLAWIFAWGAGYVLVARSCEGDNGMHATGLPGARWIDLAWAVLMCIVAGIGLAVAMSNLRESKEKPRPDDRLMEISAGAVDPEARGAVSWWGRELFMARAGVIGSAIFLGGTLLLIYPPFVLNICSQAR